MGNFILGVASSIVGACLIWTFVALLLPYVHDKLLYGGPRVEGIWDIVEFKDGAERTVGKMTLNQKGARVSGSSYRTLTRDGVASDRRFVYSGRIAGEQLTLLFEDARGRDFDSGSYIFRLYNDHVTMHGLATFHGKPENRILSEARILRKTASPLPLAKG
jgi:hypothetical protein